MVAFITKGGVFKGAVHAGNMERKKGKVMGKWGDGSLHGRRKGEVMGKWGKEKKRKEKKRK